MNHTKRSNADYQEAVLAGLETICGLLCVLMDRTDPNLEPTDTEVQSAMLRGADMMWTRVAERTGKDSGGLPCDI